MRTAGAGVVVVVACTLIAVQGSAAQNGPLPPRDTFLREAREALTRSQLLWHRYSYRERRTELHMNPFGRMGTGGTRLTEVRPAADPRLTHRRVLERNGVAVPKSDLDRQEAEYRARVAEIAREAGDADAAKGRERDEMLARQRAQRTVEEVINTLQFDLVRRETRNGRQTIVVLFAAKPDAQPTTREGRLAKAFSGTVWIEESSREVIDVDATAGDDVSFGGFIAKVYKGTKAMVKREEVAPGVWMPTRLSLSGDVRALFRRAKIDHVVEWFDYRQQ